MNNNCKANCDFDKQAKMPVAVHELALARAERTNKRLIFVIMALILALIVSNALWICHESQFETIAIQQEVEQYSENGDTTFIGDDYNGK